MSHRLGRRVAWAALVVLVFVVLASSCRNREAGPSEAEKAEARAVEARKQRFSDKPQPKPLAEDGSAAPSGRRRGGTRAAR